MTDFYIKQGDHLPILEVTLQDLNGSPIDLTSTTVRFIMANHAGVKVNRECDVVDAAGGLVRHVWQEGDTSEEGTFCGEFEIAWADQLRQTVPTDGYLEIRVVKGLA